MSYYYGPLSFGGAAPTNSAYSPTAVTEKTVASYPAYVPPGVTGVDSGAAYTPPRCPPAAPCPPCDSCPEPECAACAPCPDYPAPEPCTCPECSCPECICADGSDGVLKEATTTKSKLLIGGGVVAAVLLGVVVGRATKR